MVFLHHCNYHPWEKTVIRGGNRTKQRFRAGGKTGELRHGARESRSRCRKLSLDGEKENELPIVVYQSCLTTDFISYRIKVAHYAAHGSIE